MNHPQIILKNNRDAAIKRKHPWVFSGAVSKLIIEENSAEPKEGDLIEVFDSNNKFLAIGHFGEGTIAVRVLSFEEKEIDQSFWDKKIEAAYLVRNTIGLANCEATNTYRLVHGEGDGLAGLIIDIYDNVAVIQAHSLGMYNAIEFISQAIQNVLKDKIVAIYSKSKQTLPLKYNSNIEDGYLYNNSNCPKVVLENKLKFEIDWQTGQKTGFFIDQRENRKLLEQYSSGKSVLNTFCYSAGFSVYALKGGATKVVSVDSSAKAIELAEQNIALNFGDKKEHQAVVSDTLKYLNQCETAFDLIVLDPPAYAKKVKSKHNAIQGYKRLNKKAFDLINKGGILFTFSCSQVINRKLFEDTVTAAAIESNRKVKILHHLSQPADHPVNIYHPEGQYLKGLVLFVE